MTTGLGRWCVWATHRVRDESALLNSLANISAHLLPPLLPPYPPHLTPCPSAAVALGHGVFGPSKETSFLPCILRVCFQLLGKPQAQDVCSLRDLKAVGRAIKFPSQRSVLLLTWIPIAPGIRRDRRPKGRFWGEGEELGMRWGGCGNGGGRQCGVGADCRHRDRGREANNRGPGTAGRPNSSPFPPLPLPLPTAAFGMVQLPVGAPVMARQRIY